MTGNVEGLGDVVRRLSALQGDIEREVSAAVRTTAQMIRSDAIRSIKSHQSSGNTYKRGNVTHTASAPGNPPNQDRGQLARNIRVELHDDLTATVGSYADYSESLEFGTSRMAARPFMTPASEGQRDKHKASIAAAVKKGAGR